MDQDRFDRIARALGAGATRRAGLRAAIVGLFGVGAAALEAEARRKDPDKARRKDADADRRKRRKKCNPPCAPGQSCRKGTCACENGGTPCGANCCLTGQACQGGECVAEPNPTCVSAGEPCKNVGAPCCEGRVCASGQGGESDIACYVPKTGRCERSADCVYGMRCRSGRCEPPQPGDLAEPCDTAAQQLCTTPGAVCAAYTGSGAPGGSFCTLPLQRTCTGNPQCTCYRCWYTSAGSQGASRASTNTMSCCHAAGLACSVDNDCCLGLRCANGTCAGQICAPDGARGCGPDMPCCNEGNGASCQAGVCETCGPATCAGGCCAAGQCTAYGSQSAASCGTAGVACAACPTPSNPCKVATCVNGVCGEANATDGAACPNGACASGTCCTTGCVSGGSCVAFASQSASACGVAGATCAACQTPSNPCKVAACTAGACGEANADDYTTCTGGFCLSGTCETTCDSTNCAAGCCDGTVCKPYASQTNAKCGTAGASCAACTATSQGCDSDAGICRNCTVCSSGCPFTTIEGALADSSVSTILVQGGTYTPPNGAFNLAQLVVDRNVTIAACGASAVTISGQTNRRPFFIGFNNSPTVTLRKLTITQGYRSDVDGACVAVSNNSAVTLDRVTVSNCTTEESGGGISMTFGSPTVELIDSTVTGCIGNKSGDCTNGTTGGGIFVASGTLTLKGKTVVSGNSTPNNSCDTGGGIRAQSSTGVTSVTTASGTPVVCGNPANGTATLKSNCSVIHDGESFGGLCLGDATAGSGACPA